MSKITVATVKSFIRKHPDALIKVQSDFDGMTDCVCNDPEAEWHPLEKRDPEHAFEKTTLGYKGVWFVGHSRDWVRAYDDDGMTGFEVTNSCGCWIVAIRKE
jgi:hypothetical protein